MHYKEITKKGYLYAEAFKGKDVDLTFKELSVDDKTFKDDNGDPEAKWVAKFHETDKKLALGPVHLTIIEELIGSGDTDDMVDKTFTFYPQKGKWFGKKAVAIRVRSHLPKQKITKPDEKASEEKEAS